VRKAVLKYPQGLSIMMKTTSIIKTPLRAILSVLAMMILLPIFPNSFLVNAQNTAPNVEKVSPDAHDYVKKTGRTTVEVIIQLKTPPSPLLSAFMRVGGIRVKGFFDSLGAFAVELPVSLLAQVASFPEVESITRDRETFSTGHVTVTTGAEQIRSLPSLDGRSTMTVDGSGVGIAVLDSGIFADHQSFRNPDGSTRSRVHVDFTGENRVDDPYGHGSHVAAAAVANYSLSSNSSGTFAGVANNSHLINLRVLNSIGQGRVSSVLAAVDWLMKNGNRNKVRVVNMSFGAPAVDSYKVDPLCKAVRRLVDNGFVVVVAAGNDGKSSKGQKQYGLIHSPGNEPSAITVGATNTFGTDNRSDDVVATYSSRGPTRSFWTDSNGTKHYDNIVKPDLVAPGNRIIYAEGLNNYLVVNNPYLHVDPKEGGGSNGNTKRMMYMSGTSVSAPVVAGAAALMLQVNPNLTPNMVKMLLMFTAQPLKGFSMLDQGAGQ
jgi:serine protease AprX